MVTAGGWHDTSLAGTTAVKIPILTNPEELKQGDVLICQVQANKTPPKRQTEDWRDDVAKKRKAEAKSKAGGAAASAKSRAANIRQRPITSKMRCEPSRLGRSPHRSGGVLPLPQEALPLPSAADSSDYCIDDTGPPVLGTEHDEPAP